MWSSQTFLMLAAASLFASTRAQNDTQPLGDECQRRRDDTWFPNGAYNATGSVSVPGFRVNDSYPESTWTWSRYVNSGERITQSRAAVAQTLALKTNPIQNLSDAASIPYTGCVFAFNNLGPKSANNRQSNSEDGSCNTIFTSQCRDYILHNVLRSAAAISNGLSLSSSISCSSLIGNALSDPSPCKDQTGDMVSSKFLPNNFTDQRNELEPGCPIPNVGNSTLEDEPFFAWQGEYSEKGNYTLYDRTVLNALPVLMVVWLKHTGNETGQGIIVGNGTERWSDARLMCITANETQVGSRNLTQVEHDSHESGARRAVGSLAVMGMLAVRVVIGLVL